MIQIIGKSSLFSDKDLYQDNIKCISIRENLEKILTKKIPEELIYNYSLGFNKIIISSGLLLPKNTIEKSIEEIHSSYSVNLIMPVLLTELLLQKYSDINILLIGSESGIKGSYDTEYWLSKAALNSYVKERKVSINQKLNIICPSMIIDSPMTINRKDYSSISTKNQPKEKFLKSKDVIQLCESILNNNYICNSIIEINGGKFARQEY